MNNLPTQPTAFVGRMDELAEMRRLLNDSACRLLTLVGPGGAGKTRLALEVARTPIDVFPNGVYFVPLQPLQSIDLLVPTIAQAIEYEFFGASDPKTQLLSYLSDKSLLLVLDNFEHLLEAAELAADILASASGVKVLVTSREVLNLQEEWLYPVNGMHYPAGEMTDDMGQYDAVELFVRHARRVRPDFSLDSDRHWVMRVCEQVEGMPLALELAAAWLKRLPCREIVTEIERGLDILENPVRNVPARHRSMRTVLEHSWGLMTQAERDVLKKLSVFRGGFRREAAEQVAGATLGTLSVLVDKSMLRVDADGRYDVHELMRQYGEEHLNLSMDENQQVRDRHCAYYAEFMRERVPDLKGRRQIAALHEIGAEFDNIYTAWQQALKRQNYAAIRDMLESLSLFCEWRGRFQEGKDLLERAQAQLAAEPDDNLRPLWGRVMTHGFWLRALNDSILEHPEEDRAQLEDSLAIAQKYDDQKQAAFCLWVLGFWYRFGIRDYATSADWLEQSLALFNQVGDVFYTARAADWLGASYGLGGDLNKYIKFSRQSLDLRRALGDRFGIASSLMNLIGPALEEGHYAEAEHHIEEMGAIYLELGSRKWMSRRSVLLGVTAFQSGDFQKARRLAEEAMNLIRGIDALSLEGSEEPSFILGLLAALEEDYVRSWQLASRDLNKWRENPSLEEVLAIAACGLGEYATAKQYFLMALKLTATIHDLRGLTMLLPVAAILLAHEGQQEQAVEVLGLAFHHPASAKAWLEEWPLLKRLLDDLRARLVPEVFEAAWERGKSSDLETVAKALLKQFDDTQDQALLRSSAHQPLLESLSEREFEVLRLMAEGLSNPQIAEQLVVATGTIKAHTNNIFGKLGVSNRVQAVNRAKELHLL